MKHLNAFLQFVFGIYVQNFYHKNKLQSSPVDAKLTTLKYGLSKFSCIIMVAEPF